MIPRGHQDLMRSVDRRIDELFYETDRSPLRTGDIRRMLAEFVLFAHGLRIDADQILALLEGRKIGVRDRKRDTTVNETVAAINSRYRSVAETEIIYYGKFPRHVTLQIVDTLADSSSRGALLVAPGGFVKSFVIV